MADDGLCAAMLRFSSSLLLLLCLTGGGLAIESLLRGSVRAMRVPLENIAGRLIYDGGHTTFLRLVVAAAERTGIYTCFGSPVLDALLKWKLNHTDWKLRYYSIVEIGMLIINTCSLVDRPGWNNAWPKLLLLLAALAVAVLRALYKLFHEGRRLRAFGLASFRWLQLLPSIGLFSMLLIWFARPLTTHREALQQFLIVDAAAALAELELATDVQNAYFLLYCYHAVRDALSAFMLFEALLIEYHELKEMGHVGMSVYLSSKWNYIDQGRCLCVMGIVGLHLLERMEGRSDEVRCAIFFLQGVLYISSALNLIGYMRSFHSFAMFVHLTSTVLHDFALFMCYSLIVWLGFALAVDAQLEHALRKRNDTSATFESLMQFETQLEPPPDASLERHLISPSMASIGLGRLISIFNAGFYGHESRAMSLLMMESFPLWFFHFVYMLFINAFLLNVLIAVMTRTMTLESSEAKLVALFRQVRACVSSPPLPRTSEARTASIAFAHVHRPPLVTDLLPPPLAALADPAPGCARARRGGGARGVGGGRQYA